MIRPRSSLSWLVLLVLLVLLGSGCAAIRDEPRGFARPARFDTNLFAEFLTRGDLDLRVDDRSVVSGVDEVELLRVRFSFVSYAGYVGIDERHRSTGVLFFPIDDDGAPRTARPGRVLVTEYPPGTSATGFPFYEEYGQRPATELGLATAIVDVRGPIVRGLREYQNPDGATGEVFSSEEQFAYSMLRAYQETGDLALLWETQVSAAWLRALRAVDFVVGDEIGIERNQMTIVGEGYGALGAIQAATHDEDVAALAICGWPLDWLDYHFVRWRRWDVRGGYDPLEALQPIPFEDSRAVGSFLASSHDAPDPGCPSCVGGGDLWQAQFNYIDLVRGGWLDGVETLVLVGDADARYPLDLESRVSARAEDFAPPTLADSRGPFASERLSLPFAALRYLHDAPSTLSESQAAEAVLAWAHHVAFDREVPAVRIEESIVDGDISLFVRVNGRGATIVDVALYLTEITDRRDGDFKWRLHQRRPEPIAWRELNAIYAGSESGFIDTWRATFAPDLSRNRAYFVAVRSRLGDLEATDSLPIRPIWNLRDPAARRARP